MRLTVNFQEGTLAGMPDNEKEALVKKYKEMPGRLAYDYRNSIYCIDPSMDINCYYNYIQYLNRHYDEWKSFGYFDMGLVPLTMTPSFMGEGWWKDSLEKFPALFKCPLHSLRATSVLNGTWVGGSKDLWIARKDLARALNVSEDQATLSTLLEKLGRSM